MTRRPRLMESLAGLSRRVEQLEVALAQTPAADYRIIPHRQWARPLGFGPVNPDPATAPVTYIPGSSSTTNPTAPISFGPPTNGNGTGFVDGDFHEAGGGVQPNFSVMSLDGPGPIGGGFVVKWMIHWEIAWECDGTVAEGTEIHVSPWLYKKDPLAAAYAFPSLYRNHFVVPAAITDKVIGVQSGSFIQAFRNSTAGQSWSGGSSTHFGVPGVQLRAAASSVTGQIKVRGAVLWAQQLRVELVT